VKRQLLVVAAALVFASAGTFAVLAYVSRAQARAVAGQDPVEVVVTTGPIPRGTTVATARGAGLLGADVLPRRSVPATAVRELTPSMDQLVAGSALTGGEVVLRGRFVEDLPVAGSVDVPDGKLAVSVELTDPGRVGSFVRPGEEVAVFHFVDGKPRTTRALLPRVQVLGVGALTEEPAPTTDTEAQGKAEKPVSTAIFTLAVDERQAEQLVHASYTGQLHVGLLADTTQVTRGSGVDDTSLYR
jgi:pilus assembly protein CpaB